MVRQPTDAHFATKGATAADYKGRVESGYLRAHVSCRTKSQKGNTVKNTRPWSICPQLANVTSLDVSLVVGGTYSSTTRKHLSLLASFALHHADPE